MTMISQDVHFRKNLNLKTINDFFAPNDKFKKILIDQSLIFWAPRLMC